MEKYIEIKGKKLKINPKLDLLDESKSKVIQDKIDKANHILKTVGLPDLSLFS
jgi:hypothetical protein